MVLIRLATSLIFKNSFLGLELQKPKTENDFKMIPNGFKKQQIPVKP